ncbi:Hypp5537 [Branchiostoma lanceolatum]|uniref:Hypp5537 protein n=1 Tax=Branchiostoma lanceolatum TaxID=7740 RepID=A0A8J9VQ36_BRALA|nr:Hypp5537 [Branchiostoma lanceolatum]
MKIIFTTAILLDDPAGTSDRGACECDLAAAHCFSYFPYPNATGKPACPEDSTLPGCLDSDPSLCIATG